MKKIYNVDTSGDDKYETSPEHKSGARVDDLGRLATFTANTDFYDKNSENEEEVNRLRQMAEFADTISQLVFGDVKGKRIVDFGAGDSTSLGEKIVNSGGQYIPLDKRVEAIRRHIESGFGEARVASVYRSGLEAKSSDVVNARFVFGWLQEPQERKDAMREMFRITKDGGKVVITDYNWNSNQKNPALKNAINIATGIMSDFGFNPCYGSESHDDLNKIYQGLQTRYKGDIVCQPATTNAIDLTLKEASVIFESTAGSMLTGLETLGMNDRKSDILKALGELRRAVDASPNERVHLADIVTQVFNVSRSPEILYTEDDAMRERPCKPGECITIAKWGRDKKIVVAASSELTNSLRRIQADAYARSGLVDRGILNKGMLPEYNDSPERVKKSKYFTVIDDEGMQHCSVRYIRVDNEQDLEELREYKDMPDNAKDDLRSNYLPEQIVAISAFAKNFERGSLDDVVGAVIGLIFHAKRSGALVGIMELEESQYPVVKSIFGEDNLSQVGNPYTLDIEGVKTNKRYVSLRCDGVDFFERLAKHADRKITESTEQGRHPEAIFVKMRQAIYDVDG